MSEQETRPEYEKEYGKVWNTTELQVDFKVMGFQAPYVAVVEKATGKSGSLQFNHNPRFYFNLVLD